jgi:5-methyltetrahydropteroyltriglutamate--homocysteine methyltransferase
MVHNLTLKEIAMLTPQLPARFDHVGSFLRPYELLQAREQKAKGQITLA